MKFDFTEGKANITSALTNQVKFSFLSSRRMSEILKDANA